MVVAVRVRPLSRKEKEAQDFEILNLQDKLVIVMDRVELECDARDKKPDVLHRSKEQRFFFDKVFSKHCGTPEVYVNTCQHLVHSVIEGYNACVFAYGTTGSGKTYTMTGTPESPGIMVLILQDLFKAVQGRDDKEFGIKMSYVEIYNEVILDLLLPNARDQFLDLREDPVNGTCIAGVTEHAVREPREVMSLLQQGNKRRTTEATMANAESSRSHAICQITLVTRDRTANTEEEQMQGKLSLIDLAGSERGTVTENRGIRLREGAKINTSLLALANCINALGDKNKKGFFVPFRDSKLTRMLKDSLGGNCQTVMITTVSPAA
jgi:kinesin family protein 18/19